GNGTMDFVEVIAGYVPNTIGGNLSITAGDGDGDKIDFENASVTGNASFQLGNGTSDQVDIGTDSSGSSVTFKKNTAITFGNGGGATLAIGSTDDKSESVYFDGHASFSAGGSGNVYDLGDKVFFQFGQPDRHNI